MEENFVFKNIIFRSCSSDQWILNPIFCKAFICVQNTAQWDLTFVKMALQPCKSQLTDNKCVCAMLNLLRNEDSLKHKYLISVEQRIPFVENTVLSQASWILWFLYLCGREPGVGCSLSGDGERSASAMHTLLKGKAWPSVLCITKAINHLDEFGFNIIKNRRVSEKEEKLPASLSVGPIGRQRDVQTSFCTHDPLILYFYRR